MSKITLLYHPNEHSNFTAVHLEPGWKKYFNIEPIDTDKSYNKQDVILVSKHLNRDSWFEPWVNQGFKLVIDHLWDNGIECSSSIVDNCLTLRAPNWSWFNESLWYKQLGYDQLTFIQQPTRFFLTLMRQKKLHRTQLYERIKHFSNDSLISYTDQGVFISGDISVNDIIWQRYVNVDWYNSTCFSLVAETFVLESLDKGKTFLSEKTFKPIAFQHPFLIFGTPFTLDYLHQHGFETFDHIIDESYDTILNSLERLDCIIHQVDNLYRRFQESPRLFSDPTSLAKIQHNFNHFYNQNLMLDMFQTEVVNPLLEFAEVQ